MLLFPMPKGVIEKINKITRQFLWSGSMEKRSLALVSWDVVQLPKVMGGLSIGNIFHKNIAMLSKWIWRLLKDPSHLWCKLICDKYKYPALISILDLKVPAQIQEVLGVKYVPQFCIKQMPRKLYATASARA